MCVCIIHTFMCACMHMYVCILYVHVQIHRYVCVSICVFVCCASACVYALYVRICVYADVVAMYVCSC